MSVKKIVKHFGSARKAWELEKHEWQKIQGVSLDWLNHIGDEKLLDLAYNEIDYSSKNKIEIVGFLDDDYPSQLRECSDGPPVLFKKGKIDLEQGKFLGVVGTRKMTPRGEKIIQDIIEKLAGHPISIISGLALGVDITAHKAALKHNLPTACVLAHGLNKVFPRSNAKIADQMLENGGWISEFSSFHPPEPENFLRRNRIIAGLCQATLIVESDISGGAMSTAKHANNYNRDVFAIPGRIGDLQSKGCNHLIKTHQAFLMTEAQDVLNYLNLTPRKQKAIQKELFIELSSEEQKVIDFLQKNGKTHLDDLAHQTQQSTFQLMPVLLNLELKGLVMPLAGKNFDLHP